MVLLSLGFFELCLFFSSLLLFETFFASYLPASLDLPLETLLFALDLDSFLLFDLFLAASF